MKRNFLLLPLTAVLFGGQIFTPAAAQNYRPSRPVELVVHSALGGGSDVFGREVVAMAEREKLLTQPIRIVNKTAGAGLEAIAYLVEKKGDDHTIAIFTNTWIATPLTNKEAKYTVTDLTAIVRLVLEPTIVVVRADSPYKNMNDFVAAAKQNPLGLKQAGGSVTAIESLSGLLIQKATGVQWTFIPTPAIKDRIANLLAGNVDVIIPQPQDVNEHIQRRKNAAHRCSHREAPRRLAGRGNDQGTGDQRSHHRQRPRSPRTAGDAERNRRILGRLFLPLGADGELEKVCGRKPGSRRVFEEPRGGAVSRGTKPIDAIGPASSGRESHALVGRS